MPKMMEGEQRKLEFGIMGLIIDRRIKFDPRYFDQPIDRLQLHMDLEHAHEEVKMDLIQLLNFQDVDFIHDVDGIRRHMNRRTGELMNCFLPRCARSNRPD